MEITLLNEVDDIEDLSMFLSYYIRQKVKSGFRSDGNVYYNTEWERESIRSFLDEGPFNDEKVVVLNKGKEYSKIIYRKCKKEYSAVYGGFIIVRPCFFSISTGDMRRVGSGNTTDFNF